MLKFATFQLIGRWWFSAHRSLVGCTAGIFFALKEKKKKENKAVNERYVGRFP
jgi:hypothetical protein